MTSVRWRQALFNSMLCNVLANGARWRVRRPSGTARPRSLNRRLSGVLPLLMVVVIGWKLPTAYAQSPAADETVASAAPESPPNESATGGTANQVEPSSPPRRGRFVIGYPGVDPNSSLPGPRFAHPAREARDSMAPEAIPAVVIDAVGEYRRSGRARVIEQSDYIQYPYGKTQPVVATAPLRASIIELQPGERVLSLIAGDTQRWMIATAATGPGGSTPLIVVKPTTWNLMTNLVITTDRRVYDLTLDSPGESYYGNPRTGRVTNPSQPYSRRVKFYYPDDLVQQLVSREQLEAESRVDRYNGMIPLASTGTAADDGSTAPDGSGGASPRVGDRMTDDGSAGYLAEQLNFNYRWEKQGRFPWAPDQVFDDGAHTYIKLSREALNSPAPVLFVIGADGQRNILNYATRGQFYITDRVIRVADLVVGVQRSGGFLGLGRGKKTEQKLTITNRSSR